MVTGKCCLTLLCPINSLADLGLCASKGDTSHAQQAANIHASEKGGAARFGCTQPFFKN